MLRFLQSHCEQHDISDDTSNHLIMCLGENTVDEIFPEIKCGKQCSVSGKTQWMRFSQTSNAGNNGDGLGYNTEAEIYPG